jgi:hypothetical protein
VSFTPGAALFIDGAEVAASYAGSDDLAVLDDVQFNWGREGIWDFGEAGVLTCTLLDRTGRYAAGVSLSGLQLLFKWVGTTVTRNRFNGRVTGWSSERRLVQNPRTGLREPVWFVKITATSLMAGLAKRRLAGPSSEYSGLMPAGDPEIFTGGSSGWPYAYAQTRLNDMNANGMATLIENVQGVPGTSDKGNRPFQAALRWDETPTALEMINRIYAAQLGRPDFNPERAGGGINFVKFLKASPMALGRVNGLVAVVVNGVTTVPANRVGVPNGISAESTVADGIDVVQLRGYMHGYKSAGDTSSGTVKKEGQSTVQVPNGSPQRSNMLVADYGMAFYKAPYTAASAYPWTAAINAHWSELSDQLVALADAFRNKLRLPTLRYDSRRLPLDSEALTELVHRPNATDLPVYYPGSVFNPLPNAGPQYQVVGGVVRYQNKTWTHDVRLIPVQGTTSAPLTMQQLFGRSTATLAQWSPDLQLGDLVNVTQGLTS